ncbi:10048_t:CDS:2 [Gigaspora rosea]|nr:10048_t:CDS:2 [Gigaspora rosea]
MSYVKLKDTAATTIGHLKELIREKINLPETIKAKDLTLWKANIPYAEENIRWEDLILENNRKLGCKN